MANQERFIAAESFTMSKKVYPIFVSVLILSFLACSIVNSAESSRKAPEQKEANRPVINIIGTGSYLPSEVVYNSDFDYKSVGITDEWLAFIGLNERRHSSPNEDFLDMAYEASIKAIEEAGITPQDIDIIFMNGTLNPNLMIPTGVIELQGRLGIKSCATFTVPGTSAAAIQAIHLASLILISGEYETALVVDSSTYSRGFNYNKKSIRTLVFFYIL